MGFRTRKRVKLGKKSWVNVSKKGVSFSSRTGPFTVNTRGTVTTRLGTGIGYQGRWK